MKFPNAFFYDEDSKNTGIEITQTGRFLTIQSKTRKLCMDIKTIEYIELESKLANYTIKIGFGILHTIIKTTHEEYAHELQKAVINLCQ
jgi:hypothetical protein